MTDYTPGPFEVGSVRTKLADYPVLNIIGPDDVVVGFVLYGDGSVKQHRQAYADANLFASAPRLKDERDELLEALDTILKCDDESDSGLWDGQDNSFYPNPIQSAKLAVSIKNARDIFERIS